MKPILPDALNEEALYWRTAPGLELSTEARGALFFAVHDSRRLISHIRQEGYLLGHGLRTSILSLLIGDQFHRAGDPRVDLLTLAHAALHHDIGKRHPKIEPLTRVPGALNHEQWKLMRAHARVGAKYMQDAFEQDEAALMEDFRERAYTIMECIHSHHERMDGKGYHEIEPDHTPFMSHIIAVADAADVMMRGRSYQKPRSTDSMLAEVARCSGLPWDDSLTPGRHSKDEQFHPEAAEAFLKTRPAGGEFFSFNTSSPTAGLHEL